MLSVFQDVCNSPICPIDSSGISDLKVVFHHLRQVTQQIRQQGCSFGSNPRAAPWKNPGPYLFASPFPWWMITFLPENPGPPPPPKTNNRGTPRWEPVTFVGHPSNHHALPYLQLQGKESFRQCQNDILTCTDRLESSMVGLGHYKPPTWPPKIVTLWLMFGKIWPQLKGTWKANQSSKLQKVQTWQCLLGFRGPSSASAKQKYYLQYPYQYVAIITAAIDRLKLYSGTRGIKGDWNFIFGTYSDGGPTTISLHF